MNDLMLMFADLLPAEEIAKEIKTQAESFIENPNDETKKRLQTFCALFLPKEITDKKGVMEASKDLEEFSRIKERMNSAEQ